MKHTVIQKMTRKDQALLNWLSWTSHLDIWSSEPDEDGWWLVAAAALGSPGGGGDHQVGQVSHSFWLASTNYLLIGQPGHPLLCLHALAARPVSLGADVHLPVLMWVTIIILPPHLLLFLSRLLQPHSLPLRLCPEPRAWVPTPGLGALKVQYSTGVQNSTLVQ